MTRTPQPTLTSTPAQIAERLGVGEDRVRRIVRKECSAQIPDEIRMIPGGRVDDNVMFVYRAIFEQVVTGRAISRLAPPPEPMDLVRQRKAS